MQLHRWSVRAATLIAAVSLTRLCVEAQTADKALLNWSTFYGALKADGTSSTRLAGSGVDGTGNVYLATMHGHAAKLDPTGTSRLYQLNLPDVTATDMVVDSTGNAYLTGYLVTPTASATPGALDAGCCAVVVKIDPSGQLLFRARIGPVQAARLATDSGGNIYVAGRTIAAETPVTQGAYQRTLNGPADGFVMKLSANGGSFLYSTLLGGAGDDGVNAIAIDSTGHAYVDGSSSSTDFPITSGAPPPADRYASFVAKLNPTGSGLVYSTTAVDDIQGPIAVDAAGSAYLLAFQNATLRLLKLNAQGTAVLYAIPDRLVRFA